jgi:NRAMP (natural resistance-associated macrophage protein)-like metal ion transporter
MEEKFENFVSAPSIALEKGVDLTKKIGSSASKVPSYKKAKGYWTSLGPGLVTGAADDDPSGIATYSQQGAQTGYQLLWLALFTFPLMSIVQEMCARIGLATGRGLAGNIRINYPRWVMYSCAILLFVANTLNIGADLGAMAKGAELFLPKFNFSFLVIFFTLFMLLVQIYTPYERYARYLKWMVLVLFSYIATGLVVGLDPKQLFIHALVPSMTFSKEQIILVTAVLGTTISPYLFFWQTSHEVEEEILHGKTSLRLRQETVSKKEIRSMRVDVWSGMFVSNLVMFFIVATCAAVLYSHGIHNIATASDAALALKPLAGDKAFLLFGIGIIGTGLLAVPVLAGSAAYTVAESFHWKQGLYRKLKDARSFYGVIILSMLIGLAINFVGFNPIKMLIYSAVVNGLVAPVILVPIVQMTSNKKVMKERTSHPAIIAIGWFIVAIMVVSGLVTIFALFT